MKNFINWGLALVVFVHLGCNKEKGTCTDGIQNQDELGVDCGGACPACGTCSDGVKNQNETGIDCGGSCAPCVSCSDGVQNQGETGVDCGGPCAACTVSFSEHITATIDGVAYAAGLVAGSSNDSLILFQSDQSQERQLFFEVPLNVTAGTYNLVTATHFKARYAKLFSGSYVTYQGTMVISSNNTISRQLSGTFNFMVWEDDGFGNPIDTIAVSNGDFGAEY